VRKIIPYFINISNSNQLYYKDILANGVDGIDVRDYLSYLAVKRRVEAQALFEHLQGLHYLIVQLICEAGLRLMELFRLRVSVRVDSDVVKTGMMGKIVRLLRRSRQELVKRVQWTFVL
jgi:hypothetical protein